MVENLKATALRLEQETLDYIDRISKMLNLDRSSVLRIILREGIEKDRRERALELYTKGKFTLEQAARFGDMYIGEFLELMRERGIESNITLEMIKKGIKHMETVK